MTSNDTINELLQSTDSDESIEYLNKFLEEKQKALAELPEDVSALDRAHLQLDIAEALVGVGRAEECWEMAREAFDVFLTVYLTLHISCSSPSSLLPTSIFAFLKYGFFFESF